MPCCAVLCCSMLCWCCLKPRHRKPNEPWLYSNILRLHGTLLVFLAVLPQNYIHGRLYIATAHCAIYT